MANVPSSGESSQSLVRRLRAGDDAAWRRLVQLYEPAARRWCSRLGLPLDDADDVLQQVFVSVRQKIDDFVSTGPGSFAGWLHGLVRFRALDLRRQRDDFALPGADVLERQPAPPDRDEILAPVLRRALDLVRGEFEPDTWQMFWAMTVDGTSAELAGAAVDKSAGAARIAKARVLARLREELGDS